MSRRVYVDAWEPTDAALARVVYTPRCGKRELRQAWGHVLDRAIRDAGVHGVDVRVRASPKGAPRYTSPRGAPEWTDVASVVARVNRVDLYADLLAREWLAGWSAKRIRQVMGN